MGKRSKKRHPSRHERDQAGCIKGLISIFDFRHGRSSKKLLFDRKLVNKQVVGDGDSSAQIILSDLTQSFENMADDEESKMPLVDNSKTSVKELMEEEMFSEQGPTNQLNDSEMDTGQSGSNQDYNMKNNNKRNNRTCYKYSDLDVSELDEVLEQKPSDNLDLQTVIEELSQINQRSTNGFHSDLDVPSGQTFTVEEKLVAAVKLFVEQKLSNSEHFEEESFSKEFMEALQTLSTNKSLLKLLGDPNSVLVKLIKDLEDARLKKDQAPGSLSGSNLSEENPVMNSDKLPSRKHHNFFRRRSKSLESFLMGEDKSGQSSSKIVILKPGPVGPQTPETDMDYKMHNERNTSQFSFTEMKRKLRHAMGKERNGISPNGLVLKVNVSPKHQNRNNCEKGATGEYFGWSSPNRNHFYTERFTKVSRSKDKGSEMVDGVSNIYIEARKHLSEIVNNGENAESMTGQLAKSLGRILSLPEYNSSLCCSPRKDGDENFITSQMRLSPCGIVKNNVSGQNLGSQQCISCSNSNDEVQSPKGNVVTSLTSDQECSLVVLSLTEDSIISEVHRSSSISVEIEETEESKLQAEENIINLSSEDRRDSITEDTQNGEVDNAEIVSHCFKELDLFGEDQILSSRTVSPSCSPVSKEVEDSESAIDKLERPSPISVLEQLFTDDDISPARTTSQPVEREIQPRHIHFEEESSSGDQKNCIRISPKDEESAFEYVEAVLLGSGLNWDEFLLRWVSFNKILDSSLFEEVELFSSRSFNDQKLLFDSTNEALKEICESYFGGFTGISRVKRNIQPVPKEMDLIYEVWKRVEWHFFQHPHSHSLDQLVKRDMEISKKWMNLKSDIELIGFEMGETIFDELVEDTVMSIADDNCIDRIT
ncbi:hypothetical protein ACJIZ3_016100 [Penstemon smallii]|uniref:DUF4378 domain-containing protein n=1 Tax=Penstemon smallii TaxID=265156 RepID=A0ABD3RPE6_9LAMI